MRILFCSQAANTGGGVEVWLDDVAAALRRRGWDVHVALAKGHFHDPRRYLQRHPHPNVHELDGRSGLREQRVLSLLRAFHRLRPAIVFPVNLADALYAAAAWKQKGARTRLVTGLQKIKDEGMMADLQICAGLIDLVTTISRPVESLLRSVLPIEADRIVRMPTGVPRPWLDTPPRNRLRHLVYVGRLDVAEKQILDLADVIERIRGRGIVTHIVGSGPAEEELKSRLANAVASGEAVFHGPLRRSEVYEQIYPRMDALILFSKYEAGPMVAWEAMAHGVVPIVSDFGGREDEGVIRHGMTGLVFPVGDSATAADLVLQSSQPDALRELSKNCRQLLPPDYYQETFEQRWHEALLHCLDLPMQISDAQLPRQFSPGSIARLNLGSKSTYYLRRLLGTSFQHAEPGAEWPQRYGTS